MSWLEDLKRLLGKAKEENPQGGPPGGIPCREAAERLFEWLDGELAPELEASVGAHLRTCARCFPRLEFEKAFRAALTRAARSQEAPEHLRRRILDVLGEAGAGRQEGEDPPAEM